jgi:uracil-DNA glycosylase
MLRRFRLGKAVSVPTLTALRKEAAECRACPLWEHATQIHAKPSWSELAACRPWLDAELEVVKPRVLVCLGATAAQSLLGRDFRVTKQRGEWVESDLAEHVMATIHPSAILRAGDDREAEMEKFVEDLKLVASVL